MSVYLSVHNVTAISARCYGEISSLTIEVQGSGVTSHAVTLFTDDRLLNERLVNAINTTVRERREEKSAEGARLAAERSAYETTDDAMFVDEEVWP